MLRGVAAAIARGDTVVDDIDRDREDETATKTTMTTRLIELLKVEYFIGLYNRFFKIYFVITHFYDPFADFRVVHRAL